MTQSASEPPRTVSRTGIGAVCLYCGSRAGDDPAFAAAAAALGEGLAERDIELIFGGGSVGLMGATADAVMAKGGRATGIITTHLYGIEVGHEGLTDMVVVPTMHERKRLMFERADAFIVMPGGVGTLDELLEIMTWKQLGLHDKPVILLDTGGYWQPLRALLEHVIARGFAHSRMTGLITVAPDVATVFALLAGEAGETHHVDTRRL